MGIHQCPLIIGSCKWLDINSSIHTSQDVLRYLGTHWHQWWVCLALVNDIHQWSIIHWLLFMLDINKFIRVTRIVPLGFVMIEDYIISEVCNRNQFVTTSIKITILSSTQREQRSISNSFVYILHDPTSATTLFNKHNSSTLKVREGMLFSNF